MVGDEIACPVSVLAAALDRGLGAARPDRPIRSGNRLRTPAKLTPALGLVERRSEMLPPLAESRNDSHANQHAGECEPGASLLLRRRHNRRPPCSGDVNELTSQVGRPEHGIRTTASVYQVAVQAFIDCSRRGSAPCTRSSRRGSDLPCRRRSRLGDTDTADGCDRSCRHASATPRCAPAPALLHPLLERADHVEPFRSLAAAAVGHAGHHEQAVGTARHVARRPRAIATRVKYCDAVAGRDLRIAPAVILNSFPPRSKNGFRFGSIALIEPLSASSARRDIGRRSRTGGNPTPDP